MAARSDGGGGGAAEREPVAERGGAGREPGRERRIWRAVAVPVVAIAMVLGGGQAWVALAVRNASEPSHYTVPITAVALDLQDAMVQVTGGSESTVTMRQNLNWALRRPQVDRSVSGRVLRIKVRCPRILGVGEPGCNAALDIQVPRGTDLTVKMTSGQAVVHDLTGDVSLRAGSGELQLDNVSGRVSAQVSSGTIKGTRIASALLRAQVSSGDVSLDFVQAPQQVTLAASSGSVTATLPPDSTYKVSAHADSGATEVDPALQDPQSARTISVTAGSGHAVLGYGAGG